MRTVAKPGIAMFELVETLEDKVRQLIEVISQQLSPIVQNTALDLLW